MKGVYKYLGNVCMVHEEFVCVCVEVENTGERIAT